VRLFVGFEAKNQVLPQRQVERLCPLPGGIDPPRRLGSPPWSLSAETLAAARPDRRAWGAAWMLLIEGGDPFSLDQFADLVCGHGDPTALTACWLELNGPQCMFRLRQGEITARSASDLRALRHKRRLEHLAEEQERCWLEILRHRQPISAASQPERVRQRLESLQQLAAGAIDRDQLDDNLRKSLTALHLGNDRGELRHLLVDLGQWDPHHLVSLESSTWTTGFTPEHEAEAERLLALWETELPTDATRLDLCSQRCFTIDDDDTRDLDDALALERCGDGRLRLWIHVADPGRVVEAGSLLDLEARRRGSSLYLATGILPMFPQVLSNGPFSLRAGIRSAAWSTWVDLDDDGDIAAYGIVRSWVKPTYRLSYGDADDLIDLAPPEEADLALMDGLLSRRRRWRVSRGALLMDLPEGRIRSLAGEPMLEITEPSPSRQLVAEAMILAGAIAARFAQEHDLSMPFRSQQPAQLPPAEQLDALAEGAVRFAAIKRCLSRGVMGTQPSPHFSLGLPAYVQATSPIRRYGDLVVQRQIGDQLEARAVLTEAELQEMLEQFEAAVREGIGISREDQRHWQQVWFEAHRSGQWRAVFLRWLRPQDGLALVRIEDLAMDLAVDCPHPAEPGDDLLLRVQQVDSLRDCLKLVASAS
jgi:exoribonuclease II